jgi:non-specific serine/threonine protein kinase
VAAHTNPPRHNLSAPLTTFIGRESEVAKIKQRLSAVRLLTLTGPGGCGKTRLAIQVACDLLADFADGVWLVEFAPLADAVLVPQAVATVLGVQEQSGVKIIDSLSDHLLLRNTLLVLTTANIVALALRPRPFCKHALAYEFSPRAGKI